MKRCVWAQGDDSLMRDYHDLEYGRKKKSDSQLFEKLTLEIFQAGLLWRTVLYKRSAFRQLFFDFDIDKIAAIEKDYVEKLINDERIIRNLRKIEATIYNAKMHNEHFANEGDFKKYVYSFSDKDKLCSDLKSKGYRFVGATICESFLMSVGAIEGHEEYCFLYKGEK